MPIPIEALRAVRRIVVHANCADGRASALILHAALPQATVVEVVYNSKEHRELTPEPGDLFCDFSPWAPPLSEEPTAEERADRGAAMERWAAAGTIVLDHHEEDIVRPFGERGVFGYNTLRESGAWLAFREVWGRQPPTMRGVDLHPFVERLARRSAIRDTFQRHNGEWEAACRLALTLRFLPLADLLAMGVERALGLAEDIGPVLLAQHTREVEEAVKGAVIETIAGHSVAIIPSVTLTSDAADVLGRRVDVVAGFQYVHEHGTAALVWSLRSHAGVDVRAIAKCWGGGGHKPAAGFRVRINVLGLGESPYQIARRCLQMGIAGVSS